MKGGASCDPPPPLTCALGVSLIPSPSSTHTESRLQTHRPRESHIPLFAESKSLRSKLLHQPFRTPPPYPPFITDKPDENDYWNSSRSRWFLLSSTDRRIILGGVHWCLVWSGWTTRPCHSWSCQVKVVLKWFGCSRCFYCNLVDVVALALVEDHLVDVSVPVVALIAKRRHHRKDNLFFWTLPKLGGPPCPTRFWYFLTVIFAIRDTINGLQPISTIKTIIFTYL